MTPGRESLLSRADQGNGFVGTESNAAGVIGPRGCAPLARPYRGRIPVQQQWYQAPVSKRTRLLTTAQQLVPYDALRHYLSLFFICNGAGPGNTFVQFGFSPDGLTGLANAGAWIAFQVIPTSQQTGFNDLTFQVHGGLVNQALWGLSNGPGVTDAYVTTQQYLG